MAIQFNGVNQYLDVGNVLNPTPNITVMGWVRRNAIGVRHEILSKEATNSLSGYQITLLPSNVAEFSHFGASSTTVIGSTPITNTDAWYHICGVRDVAGGATRLYVNGVLDGTGGLGVTPVANTISFTIGRAPGFTGRFFNGLIEDVRVYDRALNPAEIESIYTSQGADSVYDGIVARWPMTEREAGFSLQSNVYNITSTQSAVSGSSISLSYTVPSDIIEPNLFLAVTAGGYTGSNAGNSQASSASFGGNGMAKIGGTNSSSLGVGIGIAAFGLAVSPGDSATITVNHPRSINKRALIAYVVSNISGVNEGTATANSASGATTVNVTTSGLNRLILNSQNLGNDNAMSAVGTGNILLESILNGSGTDSGLGLSSVLAGAAGTYSGIGITMGAANRSAQIATAVPSTTFTIFDLSNNAFHATAVGGTYQEGYIRRRLFSGRQV